MERKDECDKMNPISTDETKTYPIDGEFYLKIITLNSVFRYAQLVQGEYRYNIHTFYSKKALTKFIERIKVLDGIVK